MRAGSWELVTKALSGIRLSLFDIDGVLLAGKDEMRLVSGPRIQRRGPARVGLNTIAHCCDYPTVGRVHPGPH